MFTHHHHFTKTAAVWPELSPHEGHQMASSSRALASSQETQPSVRVAVYNAGAIQPNAFTSRVKRPWFDAKVTLYKNAYLVKT